MSLSLAQSAVWRAVLRTTEAVAPVLNQTLHEADGVIFTGCGSAFNMARSACTLYQLAMGRPAIAVSAGDLCLHPAAFLPRSGSWGLVATSWSGDTPELLEAVTVFRQWSRAGAIGLTARAEAPLAGRVDRCLVLPTDHGADFACALLALQTLAAYGSGDFIYRADLRGLPDAAEQLLADTGLPVLPAHINRIVCLGSGSLYGVASEGARMLEAVARIPCVAYPAPEFRHGPHEVAGPGTLVLVLQSTAGTADEEETATAVQAAGATVLAVGPRPAPGVVRFPCATGLHDRIRPALYHLALQVLAGRHLRGQAAGVGGDAA